MYFIKSKRRAQNHRDSTDEKTPSDGRRSRTSDGAPERPTNQELLPDLRGPRDHPLRRVLPLRSRSREAGEPLFCCPWRYGSLAGSRRWPPPRPTEGARSHHRKRCTTAGGASPAAGHMGRGRCPERTEGCLAGFRRRRVQAFWRLSRRSIPRVIARLVQNRDPYGNEALWSSLLRWRSDLCALHRAFESTAGGLAPSYVQHIQQLGFPCSSGC